MRKINDGAILTMVCEYTILTNGGAVRPYMLATWANLSRQQSATRLKLLEADGLLRSQEYLYRPGVLAKRYMPTARTLDLHQDNRFLDDYMSWLATSKNNGKFFVKMITGSDV